MEPLLLFPKISGGTDEIEECSLRIKSMERQISPKIKIVLSEAICPVTYDLSGLSTFQFMSIGPKICRLNIINFAIAFKIPSRLL
jgi:hypothetical protein